MIEIRLKGTYRSTGPESHLIEVHKFVQGCEEENAYDRSISVHWHTMQISEVLDYGLDTSITKVLWSQMRSSKHEMMCLL